MYFFVELSFAAELVIVIMLTGDDVSSRFHWEVWLLHDEAMLLEPPIILVPRPPGWCFTTGTLLKLFSNWTASCVNPPSARIRQPDDDIHATFGPK